SDAWVPRKATPSRERPRPLLPPTVRLRAPKGRAPVHHTKRSPAEPLFELNASRCPPESPRRRRSAPRRLNDPFETTKKPTISPRLQPAPTNTPRNIQIEPLLWGPTDSLLRIGRSSTNTCLGCAPCGRFTYIGAAVLGPANQNPVRKQCI